MVPKTYMSDTMIEKIYIIGYSGQWVYLHGQPYILAQIYASNSLTNHLRTCSSAVS